MHQPRWFPSFSGLRCRPRRHGSASVQQDLNPPVIVGNGSWDKRTMSLDRARPILLAKQ